MAKKKYNEEYINQCEQRIREIQNDEKEYDDWTQICLSVQNAVQAASNVWGASTEEDIHKMNCFIRELIVGFVLKNLTMFDIVFRKKK